MKKTIILQQLRLLNFKGIRSLTLEFEGTTNIYGKNGTGKSTIEDAWNWLLFGKDSQGRTTFEIKTLDKYNNVIPKIEHEVEGLLLINDKPVTLRRVLREKWNKPRGQAEAVFNGNETLFYWNDVPMQAGEYSKKIQEIMDEGVFKLITNPMAFDGLKWQDRRQVLIEMCGDVQDEDIAAEHPEYASLAETLNTKSLEEHRREMAARRKKLRDDLKMIPTRIDEVEKSKPEPLDFEQLEKDKASKEFEIKKIEDQIEDKSKVLEAYFERKNEHVRKVHQKKSEAENLKSDIERNLKNQNTIDTTELDRLTTRLKFKEIDLKENRSGMDNLLQKQKSIASEREDLRNRWHELNEKELVLNEEEFKCPTCQRAFEAEDIEQKKAEMKENFFNNKQQKLEAINESGKALKKQYEENEKLLQQSEEFEEDIKAEIGVIKTNIEKEEKRIAELKENANSFDLEAELQKHEGYQKLVAEIKALEAEEPKEETVDTAELKQKKNSLKNELDEIKEKLSHKSAIESANNRIKELEEQETNLSKQLLEVEQKEFEAESFVKLKIETLERKINANFKFVNFKMFDQQINGGIQEVCEALIDGVPFSNANTASRVNAGLDIINSLCKFYRVNAPIFIDNRESVINLIDTDSQIINLIVSRKDEKLRVESVELENVA
ncbi:hypothetical protein C7S20_19280 [Christiangramia fulva]|uniref:Uncharacterized protein n=1 Tax=Christiangramia fulva TaxID=2126553 RepID=A0A2R3ZAD2_9FLAO|nr:ATP-binding protein [Christiangramia fulva]AVR47221.1 hypothetical protein C7S20_19280 [Christiangramia fulva]